MQAALIIMTIMGCDDAAASCHYVATLEKRWPSMELCETASEEQLGHYVNSSNYPVLIATCRMPAEAATTTAAAPPAAEPPKTEEKPAEEQASLAKRAIERARAMLPSTDGVKTLAARPVHFVADGYSWIVSTVRR